MRSFNSNPEGGRPAGGWFLAAVLVFAALHAAAVFQTFPPKDLLNDRIFFREDYPLHFYDAATVSQIILERGRTWGYDPYRMAGYPIGTIYSMDNKAVALATALLRFLGPERVYKGLVAAVFLSFPVLLWFAARNFGAGRAEALLALFLFLGFFTLDRMTIAFTAFGGFSFLLACPLMLFLGSLWYRCLQDPTPDRSRVAWFFAGSLLFWVHVSSATIFPVLAAATLVWERARLTRTTILVFCAWAVTALVVNGPWLTLLLRFWDTKTLSHAFPYFSAAGWEGIRIDAADPQVWIRQPLLLLAAFCFSGRATPARFGILWASCLFFLFLAYFGDILPLVEHLEPYRYVIPAYICLCIPAAAGCLRVLRFIRRKRAVPALAFVLLFLLLVALPSFRGSPLTGISSLRIIRITTDYDPRGIALIRTLEEHTSRAGRILMEDAGYEAGGMQYYDSYLLGVLPYFIDREILGGPQPDTPLTFHLADFTNGVLFQRPVEAYDAGLLRTYLDAYNIHWVVAWSDPSKRAFDAFVPDVLEVLTDIDKFTIYRVQEPSSFFLKGGGDLEVGLDRIEIRNATAGEIVLKYHYVDFLESRPPLPLERAPMLDNPVGFIRIVNEPHHPHILIRSGSIFGKRKASP